MEDDDPWGWSIDRVVQEFCTENRSWELRAAATPLPDPVYLENAFRENEITGDVLLIEVDDKALREDLQITKLGWRSTIRYGIDQLRERSPRYKEWFTKESALGSSVVIPEQYSNSLPSVSSRPDFNFMINSTVPIHMPATTSGIQNLPSLQPLRLPAGPGAEGRGSSSNSAVEDTSNVPRDNKRRRLDDELLENGEQSSKNRYLEPLLLAPSISPKHSESDSSNEQIPFETSNDTSIEAQSIKKRKRITPTLVTTAIDHTRDRTIRTEADTVRIYLHSQLDHGYLGNSQMSANDVFYGSIAVGEQIPSSEMVHEFQERSAISTGRRLYIHGLMKHFLRVNPELLERNEKTSMAIKPYHLRLAQNPSFTLYRSASDGTTEVTRQALSLWPEINPGASLASPSNTGKSTFNFDSNVEGSLIANAYDDPGALSKYNMLKDDDEELPLYGESGSEGYDTETWEAIEEEKKEMAAYLEKQKLKNKFLTPQEVITAVDSGIADLVSKWQETKLPKRRQKAFRLWKRSRRTGSKHAEIQKAQQDLKHLVDSRIPKLRENIILGQWSNEDQVRRQTQIMEATIFDREDFIYTIALLQQKSPPPKLTADIPVKPKKAILSGNDSDSGESIHSESSAVESIKDMGDFIVEELDLADDEEDVNMSDDDLPVASVTPSRGVGRLLPRSGSTPQHDHNSEEDHDMDSLPDEELGSPEPMVRSPFGKIKNEPTGPPITSTPKKETTFIDLVTPESNRVPKFNLNLNSSSVNPIILSSESDREKQSRRPLLDLNNRPSLMTPAAVSRFEYETWEDSQDRERLIITVVDKLSNQVQKSLFELIATMNDETELRTRVEESIDLRHETKGLDEKLSMALLTLVRLFWIFIDCKFHLANDGWMHIAAEAIRDDNFNSLGNFYKLCRSLQSYFNPKIRLNFSKSELPSEPTLLSDDEEDGEPQGLVKRKRKPVSTSDSEEFLEEEEESPSKKSRKFLEDADARNMREQDRARAFAQEERKKQLRARLKESDGVGDVALDRHIINEGKFEDQGYIYVDEEIGKRIKPHQLDGVRFVWNQITADGKATQGCLLAHTMGLGKTMQTITILVALAQAASSKDESVSSQVPESLRVSKTLVLCPPGLIANWVDELLTWSPDNILGELRPVESSSDAKSRLRTIDDWFYDGGVLLMGYDMFRSIVNPAAPKSGKPVKISPEKFECAKSQLLEGPNVVVADEAHKMKNHKSALTMAASQFKTKTRIALTGSPLANNVEEYHTMVEWIAPNYLGPVREFRQKYKDPIEAGLYTDSSRSERSKSKKMLEVLNADLSPKVHRADTSVLRDDLPPKKEFIINVSLTELQKQAYITYVRSMSSQSPARTKSGELKQTTLWSYISVLTLLVNHPSCFKAKLDERNSEIHAAPQSALRIAPKGRSRKDKPINPRDVIDEDVENDPEAWKAGVSEDLISAEARVFESVLGDITNPELSNKIRILCQILDASRAVGDKVLVFSQTLVTLDFIQAMCIKQGRKIARLDGKTAMGQRQTTAKDFNTNDLEVYLISTNAGGLGLNLFGANRVVIFDFKYNPINEEQAIGRAYRIGQRKHVFVYRLMAAGTFEISVQNKTVFKTQLASTVVDKKNPMAWAEKNLGETILFEPKEIPQEDLSVFEGMDRAVLDNILSMEENKGTILKIIQSDDFEKDDDYRFTAKEKAEIHTMIKEEQLKRSDPQAYHTAMRKKAQNEAAALRPQQVQLIGARQQIQPQTQTNSFVKNEIVNGNKPGKNMETKNSNSDLEEISATRYEATPASPGQIAKKSFIIKLKTIARNMDQFKDNEVEVRERAIEATKSIRSAYEARGVIWNDDRQRMIYQRQFKFIHNNWLSAQQLLARELGAEEFIDQAHSWWVTTVTGEDHTNPTPTNDQQVQNPAPLINRQELQGVVPLAKNINNHVVDKDDMIHPQSHSLAAESSRAIEPGGNGFSSQDSVGDIPSHKQNSSLVEVIQHPGVPSDLTANLSDENRREQSADNTSIGTMALNTLVEATTNGNVKTKMFQAMNRQPQSLRIPVVSPPKKTKSKNRGTMHAEDSEAMRLLNQRRLARGQSPHTPSPSKSTTKSFARPSQGTSAQST